MSITLTKIIKKPLEDLNLKPVVFLYGEEDFLKKQFLEKFKETGKDFHFFWGDETSLQEIKDVFSSGSLFSEGSVVVIWDVDAFLTKLNKKEKEEFKNLLKTLTNPDQILLISLKEKPTQVLKWIGDIASVIQSPKLTPKAFEISIYKKIKSEGRDIDLKDLQYLLKFLPKNLYDAKHEIEKLLLYTEGKETITREDIDSVILKREELNVFSFLYHFFKKDVKALDVLKKLLQQGHHPFEVQALILTYANKLLLFHTYRQQGLNEGEIFKKLNMNYKLQRSNFQEFSRVFSKIDTIDLIKDLYQLEILQKVEFQDPQQLLEDLIIKYTHP